jgi:hypothetical protein
MDIFGRFVRTFELVTYTKIFLTLGGSNHGGKWSLNYFGTIGEVICVMLTKNEMWGCY